LTDAPLTPPRAANRSPSRAELEVRIRLPPRGVCEISVPLGFRDRDVSSGNEVLSVGFVGVLMITHSGAGTLAYGALFALGNAVPISK
jgi:hypothetical protein